MKASDCSRIQNIFLKSYFEYVKGVRAICFTKQPRESFRCLEVCRNKELSYIRGSPANVQYWFVLLLSGLLQKRQIFLVLSVLPPLPTCSRYFPCSKFSEATWHLKYSSSAYAVEERGSLFIFFRPSNCGSVYLRTLFPSGLTSLSCSTPSSFCLCHLVFYYG